jgi:hypothetical protein
MIVAFVQFPKGEATADEMRERYQSTAPKYQKIVGLIRKYYLLSENGQMGGGVYLFESKEAAEKLYTAEWRQYVKELYGAEPAIQYFECPVVVDNPTEKILTS